MRALAGAALCLWTQLAAQQIQLTPVVSGAGFVTGILNAGDGSGRLFLVDQRGVIRILRNGALLSTPFLDISSKVLAGGERGLLGLAFPPGYAANRRFYVHYSDLNGDTTVAMYRAPANPDVADPASEAVLLHVTQPYANHNGGQLAFGPDGYLYIGLGDGGSGGDPQGNGQNLGALLGKILRVDPETEPGRLRIPPDNPFVNRAGARAEIWAYGLRNPWRFSFDRSNGALYIADVGQAAYEEIDYEATPYPGRNYGWNILEGAHCYAQSSCNMQGLALPVAEYGHDQGCSVTGGYVYRGRAAPGLRGIYFYGDYCSGRIWGLEREGSGWNNRLLLTSGRNISTFGEDEAGEIYLADGPAGAIYRLEGDGTPRIGASGVVNAASFAPGLTAGSAATVFATGILDDPGVVTAQSLPLPVSLNGVSVTVNGVPAPLFALANRNGQEQVNFQAPLEIAGLQTASVAVTRAGRSSAAAQTAVMSVQPAVFTSDGVHAVAVHNSDYSLVTPERPLRRGEYAFVYAVGLGPASNAPANGSPAPVSPLARAQPVVTVALGGAQCEVQFAGLAPGLAGVYQVNFRVPAGAPGGDQPLVIAANGVSGPAVTAPLE